MWFIGVEAEQETSAPPSKKNPGSAPDSRRGNMRSKYEIKTKANRENFTAYK